MASEERLKQIPIDAKLITVMGGVNDWSQNRELGTIDDIENTTIYGALNLIVSYISKNYPQSKSGLYSEDFEKEAGRRWFSGRLAFCLYGCPWQNKCDGVWKGRRQKV